jgi:hypothetical protein
MRNMISDSMTKVGGFSPHFTLQIENYLLALGVQKFTEMVKNGTISLRKPGCDKQPTELNADNQIVQVQEVI